MNKSVAIVAAVALGLMLCTTVSAYTLSGTVYFDWFEGYPAPCSWVKLFQGSQCLQQYQMSQTAAGSGGHYEFIGLFGNYSVRAYWGITYCAPCDTVGPDCDDQWNSECANVTIGGNTQQNLHFNDIDCHCE